MSDWIRAQADLGIRQSGKWSDGTAGGGLYCARVLRAGSRAASGVATFFDCVLLSREWGELDLNGTAEFNATSRPVYPALLNCACVADASVGDYVLIRWQPDSSRTARQYIPLTAEAYDICPYGSDGTIVSTDTGGGADGYFQGHRDLGFAGMIAD